MGLAQARIEDGEFAAVEEYLVHAAAIVERVNDPELRYRLAWSRARLDLAAGRYPKAASEFRRLIESADPDADLLSARTNLAAALVKSGNAKDGEREQRLVLRESEAALGLLHPRTIQAIGNLGGVLFEAGNYSEATTVLRRHLAAAEQTGMEDTYIADAQMNLAGALTESGTMAEAAALLEPACATLEARRGPEHPDTGMCWLNQGVALLGQGELASGRGRLSQAATALTAALGGDHPLSLQASAALGEAFLAAGDARAAIEAVGPSLAMAERSLGPDSPHLGYGLLALGRAELALDRAGAAIPPLERALELAPSQSDPALRAEAAYALARALHSRSGNAEGPRVRKLLDESAESFTAAQDEESAREVVAWRRKAGLSGDGVR